MEEMNPSLPEPGWKQEIFSSNLLPFHFTSPLRNEAIPGSVDVMVISDDSELISCERSQEVNKDSLPSSSHQTTASPHSEP